MLVIAIMSGVFVTIYRFSSLSGYELKTDVWKGYYELKSAYYKNMEIISFHISTFYEIA